MSIERIKMKIDKTTKVLLALIALGLWLNVVAPLFHPVRVAAEDKEKMEQDLHDIAHDVHALYSGVCLNSKICD
jgi:hypothetical protein